MSQQPNHPIDLKQLNQISEGDIEFEIEVLQVYVEDVFQRIAKIHEAIAHSDRAQLMAEAHHIKGSSSNVGALPMRNLAVQLENLNLDYDSEQALEIVADMREKMKAVEVFVAELSAKAD
jgi:HPt (histidine-containing phosphotransfer) domain-containing protein